MSAPLPPQTPITSSVSTLDVMMTLTRVETKVDTFVHQASDHETRIRALETRRWPLASANLLIAIGALGIAAATFFAR